MIQTASSVIGNNNNGANQMVDMSNSPGSETPVANANALTPVGTGSNSGSQTRKITQFSNKLYNMVNDSSTDSLIRWSERGDSFFVIGHEDFAKLVLPRYFKHNNFSSFVRQLNMYGFHKVPHIQQGVLQSDSPNELLEFANPNFQRDQPELLCYVTRKKGGSQVSDDASNSLDMSTITMELQNIRNQQLSLSSELSRIQVDNAALWQENIETRERQRRHQETIDKILRFLASVYLDGKQNPPSKVMPRSRRLLLEAKYPSVSNPNLNANSNANRTSSFDASPNSSATNAKFSPLGKHRESDSDMRFRSMSAGPASSSYVSTAKSETGSPQIVDTHNFMNEFNPQRKNSTESLANPVDTGISPHHSPANEIPPSSNQEDTLETKLSNTGDIINMLDDAGTVDNESMNTLSPLLFDYQDSGYPPHADTAEESQMPVYGTQNDNYTAAENNVPNRSALNPYSYNDYLSNVNPPYLPQPSKDQLINYYPGYSDDQKRIANVSDGITKQDQNIQALADILGIPLSDVRGDPSGNPAFASSLNNNYNLPLSSDLDSVLNVVPSEESFSESNPVFDEFTNISNLTSPPEISTNQSFDPNNIALPGLQKAHLNTPPPSQVRKKRKSSVGI
ncbi:transcription factor Hsf1 [Schizosaccharomyces cryophilus OY26]|uniref:Transcription factor Hsf1 n=1 Tax=Schizosaccharomyces cryophilus (strain OY26 / ATCC MYA-4695 / CBS 11777 / NBRC 106824 / NRRL Y48691) TaxID=653667 RepID=S9W3U6_SCHCR|nr:transcription factor Hsf1 [Schizosaccharomyces cryophilus OY26]EPY52620.1 transcription factor Hsf1 [Schizosaccharomyces cryophilus OY26]